MREFHRRAKFEGILNQYINEKEGDHHKVKSVIPTHQPVFSSRKHIIENAYKQVVNKQAVEEDVKPEVIVAP